jgi:FkbM family methyltransferase
MSDQQAAFMQALQQRQLSEQLWLRKRVARMEAMERLTGAGRRPVLPLEFTSQCGEDCWLWDLFEGQLDGFYIEVGAFDGYTCSVTYPFEAIGWKGVLVEPIPEKFELARARRPNSRVVHAALAGPGSKGTCTFNVVDAARPHSGMLSFLAVKPANTSEVKASGGQVRKVTVPVTSMNAVLEGHQGPIDFAVIDVEGAEVDLLRGFDLAKYRPRVLVVEEGFPSMNSPAKTYLASFPYSPAGYVWINRVYIRNDEEALLKRAAALPV